MKCEEFEAQLNEILDERRRVEWDERLRAHGAQCPACRELAAAYGVLFEGFFALPAVQPSADFSQRVVESYLARPRVASYGVSRRSLAMAGGVLTTAAAVLVAVLLTRDEPSASQQVALVEPAVVEPAVVEPAVAQVESSIPADWDEVGDIPVLGPLVVAMDELEKNPANYEQLAKDTGQGLAQLVLRMPAIAGPQGIRLVSPAMFSAGGVLPTEVSDELRPVTESVTETFNLLLKALPVSFAPTGRERAS